MTLVYTEKKYKFKRGRFNAMVGVRDGVMMKFNIYSGRASLYFMPLEMETPQDINDMAWLLHDIKETIKKLV